jgi:hypothetical protein
MLNQKHPSPYLKMKVLGAIEFAEGKSIIERIKKVAFMSFVDELGFPRKFTWSTIQTWYSRYKQYGLTTMLNKPRSDKGKTRKIDLLQVVEAIEQVLPMLRTGTTNKALMYKLCIEKGLLRREQIAPNTFSRFIFEHELLKNNSLNKEKREAWSKLFANELWQGDSMFGPHVKENDTLHETWLIAFIDDASRVVTHGQFFLQNDTNSLISALQPAVYKRGIPEQFYFDNGSNYVSKEISLICSRLGIILSHTPVRDGAAKGKIERFFRTVRENFLVRNLDLSSLDALNRQFYNWLEEEYNSKVHSGIGMRPIDRFGLDLKRIRFLPPCDANDELYYLEDDRKVKKDNTFPFNNIRYEAPRDFREKVIQVRYQRLNPTRVIVYYKNERMGEARKLNTSLNDKFIKEN